MIHTHVQALTLDGEYLQGSLIRGTLVPGATLFLNDQRVDVSEQGHFVFGFSRDDKLTHLLKWQLPGEKTWSEKTLNIQKRAYRIQRIDGLDQNKVTPPSEVLARIRNDAQRVRRARSEVSTMRGFTDSFIWPSDGVITGVYGSQRILNGKPSRPHFGIDLAASTGTPVVAPASGVVTLADPDLYYSGATLIIDHGLGVFSTFLHLDSFAVGVGETVSQGQKIGEVGSSGRSTGPHLDWRINWKSVRLDPALLVPERDGLDYSASSRPSQDR
ncbi:M23 family metallopeptidase [Alteromonas sediminis]|uniref:M23 family metallopeptidase n=1 Tax=Alteromonas sediminis TaxID=2259342 RepID=UPI0030B83EBE